MDREEERTDTHARNILFWTTPASLHLTLAGVTYRQEGQDQPQDFIIFSVSVHTASSLTGRWPRPLTDRLSCQLSAVYFGNFSEEIKLFYFDLLNGWSDQTHRHPRGENLPTETRKKSPDRREYFEIRGYNWANISWVLWSPETIGEILLLGKLSGTYHTKKVSPVAVHLLCVPVCANPPSLSVGRGGCSEDQRPAAAHYNTVID